MSGDSNENNLADSLNFRRLAGLGDTMSATFERFDAEMKELWSGSRGELETVVRCHLILESFLSRYIFENSWGFCDPVKARLSFHQKVRLIQKAEPIFALIVPGIDDLNQIRNRLVHNLKFEFKESDIDQLKAYVNLWQTALGYKKLSGTAAVTKFTEHVCSIFHNPALNKKI